MNMSLMEVILSNENIASAWKQVKRNGGSAGIDGITIEQFPEYFRPRWQRIKKAVLKGYYIPSPVERVEIPKKTGGIRKLGIPTVLDRMIQQAIAQVLNSIFDHGFSEASYGFRPKRSAHGAIKRIHEYVKSEYRYAVDVDIEKFFDNVDHDILMHKVARKVKDKRVLKLIGRYLRAGVCERNGTYNPSLIGTPQGGPLSPLLSNIMLHELDTELEQRHYCFARYADDFVVVTRTKEEGETILEEITAFLKTKLKLTVNATKSKVVPMEECSFLGFTFRNKKIIWTDKSFKDFQYKVKRYTNRSWGVSMQERLEKLSRYIRGWMNYFGISQFYSPIQDIDNWIRRRIRMCYWKMWRKIRTKVRNLTQLGIPLRFAIINGISSKSYWRLSKTPAVNAAMSNEWLEKQGLVNVKLLWCKSQGYV